MSPPVPADSVARPVSLAGPRSLLSCCGRGMDTTAEVGICAQLWVNNSQCCSLISRELLPQAATQGLLSRVFGCIGESAPAEAQCTAATKLVFQKPWLHMQLAPVVQAAGPPG